MRRMEKTRVAALVAVMALVLAACTGDVVGTTTTGAPEEEPTTTAAAEETTTSAVAATTTIAVVTGARKLRRSSAHEIVRRTKITLRSAMIRDGHDRMPGKARDRPPSHGSELPRCRLASPSNALIIEDDD